MYDVSKEKKKICIQFHVCTFLLLCSNAFYNLKVYVIQTGGRRKKKIENMQKIVPLFIMMLYHF